MIQPLDAEPSPGGRNCPVSDDVDVLPFPDLEKGAAGIEVHAASWQIHAVCGKGKILLLEG